MQYSLQAPRAVRARRFGLGLPVFLFCAALLFLGLIWFRDFALGNVADIFWDGRAMLAEIANVDNPDRFTVAGEGLVKMLDAAEAVQLLSYVYRGKDLQDFISESSNTAIFCFGVIEAEREGDALAGMRNAVGCAASVTVLDRIAERLFD